MKKHLEVESNAQNFKEHLDNSYHNVHNNKMIITTKQYK